MAQLHLNVLPPHQRRLWEQFQTRSRFLRQKGYYLAGGSGLALQIGHRQSIDFDFFSSQKGLGPMTQDWLKRFNRFVVRDLDKDTVHADVEGVKVSFIGAYRYPAIEPLLKAEGIRIAGLLDIALMKLLALTHRATMRDYIDLAAILRDRISLKKLLDTSPKKYGRNFDPMVFLRALATFTDIEPEMPALIDSTLKTSWQKILRKAVKEIAG